MSDQRGPRAPTDHSSLLTRHCLFVYGTLTDDGLIAELTGRRFHKRPALLPGYRKETPPGGYPYVVPDPQAGVEGFLLLDLTVETLRVLDHYEDEGQLYRRTEVVVTVGDRRVRAWVYEGIRPAD